MDDAELIGSGAVGHAVQTRRGTLVFVHGLVAERAPHAFERASVRIHDDDAMIAVTVGDEHFVGLRIHHSIRRLMEILGVSVALALRATADLLYELTVLRKLQK